MFIPYTYAIRCRSTGQRYYGVRYARGCSPCDLWISYFTSSKHVKRLIETYGLADFEVQVRKTFSEASAAILWEHKFLTRIDVLRNSEWINYSIGGILRATRAQAKDKNAFKIGHKRSSAETAKRSANYETVSWVNRRGENKLVKKTDVPYYRSVGFIEGRTSEFKTPKFKLACANRIGSNNPAFGKKRPDLSERNSALKGLHRWVNNGVETRRVAADKIMFYIEQGFSLGRLNVHTASSKEKISISQASRTKKISPDMIIEIRQLKTEGLSNRAIAARLDIAASSVHRYQPGPTTHSPSVHEGR